MSLFVKICGMTTPAAVSAAVACEVDGIGRTTDWDAAADLAMRLEVILAGGLNAANVAAAIRHVRPFGVDVSSGVEESPGIKNTEMIEQFVAAARMAALE